MVKRRLVILLGIVCGLPILVLLRWYLGSAGFLASPLRHSAGTPSGQVYEKLFPVVAGYRQNVPMRFYGRVLDQNNSPIPGTRVSGTYSGFTMAEHLQHRDFSPHPITATTDENGYFELPKLVGIELCLNDFERMGYRFVEHPWVYVYSNDTGPIFKPDPAHPEIFAGWRESADAQTLTPINVKGGSPESAWKMSIWLDRRFRVEPGEAPDADLYISMSYSMPRNLKVANGPDSYYDWRAVIDVPHGGIMPTSDPYLYRAPESGYKSRYEYSRSATDTDWRPDNFGHRSFYIRYGNPPRFGNLTIELRTSARNGGSGFIIHGAVNPDGSTNLQPKP
jgi:hypothetical protein